jgi:Glycosyltransferase 61
LLHRKINSAPTGILITGPTHNFFHWLLECLPSIFLAEKSVLVPQEAPFLIPNGYLGHKNSVDAFSLFRGSRAVFHLAQGVWYGAQNTYVVEGPTVPGTMRPGSYVLPASGQQANEDGMNNGYHFEFMTEYRAELIRRVGVEREQGPRRVYLARKPTARRDFNRSEVASVLAHHGFTTIVPEDFTLKQIASIMEGAEVVVGPQGAQWANTVFCQPEMRALQFNGSVLSASFTNLADLVGYQLNFMSADEEVQTKDADLNEAASHSTRAGFSVNPQSLSDQLEKIL